MTDDQAVADRLSRTMIYRRMNAGRFPQSTPISDEQRRWDEGSPA